MEVQFWGQFYCLWQNLPQINPKIILFRNLGWEMIRQVDKDTYNEKNVSTIYITCSERYGYHKCWCITTFMDVEIYPHYVIEGKSKIYQAIPLLKNLMYVCVHGTIINSDHFWVGNRKITQAFFSPLHVSAFSLFHNQAKFIYYKKHIKT